MNDHITEHLPSKAAAAPHQGPLTAEPAIRRGGWMKEKAWLIRSAVFLGVILGFSALLLVGYRRGERQEQEIGALRGQVGTLQKELAATNRLLQSTEDKAASLAYVREMGHRANAILDELDTRLRKNETIARAAAVKAVAAENQLKELEKRVKKLEGP